MIRPAGPTVLGPTQLAGPPLLDRIVGPMNKQAMANQNSFKDTAAPIVGTLAGIISNYFVPGSGFFASKAADRTVREQVNVVNGRPFFEGVDNNGPGYSDAAGIIASLAGAGFGGGASGATEAGFSGVADNAAGYTGAAASTAGNAASSTSNFGTKLATLLASYGLNQGAAALDRRGRRGAGYQPTPISGTIQRLPAIYGGY